MNTIGSIDLAYICLFCFAFNIKELWGKGSLIFISCLDVCLFFTYTEMFEFDHNNLKCMKPIVLNFSLKKKNAQAERQNFSWIVMQCVNVVSGYYTNSCWFCNLWKPRILNQSWIIRFVPKKKQNQEHSQFWSHHKIFFWQTQKIKQIFVSQMNWSSR